MSQQAANADRAAAAYWKSVAGADRTEAAIAAAKATTLTADARREAAEPKDSARRAAGVRGG